MHCAVEVGAPSTLTFHGQCQFVSFEILTDRNVQRLNLPEYRHTHVNIKPKFGIGKDSCGRTIGKHRASYRWILASWLRRDE